MTGIKQQAPGRAHKSCFSNVQIILSRLYRGSSALLSYSRCVFVFFLI